VIWPNFLSANPNELKTFFIYISKRDTIKSLKEKIQRILCYYPTYLSLNTREFRIWKNLDFESLLPTNLKFEENYTISIKNGVLLNDQTNLEVTKILTFKIKFLFLKDAEIINEDTLLIECKIFAKWILQIDNKQMLSRNNRNCGYCKCSSDDLLRCVCLQVKKRNFFYNEVIFFFYCSGFLLQCNMSKRRLEKT